jgi:hypothetical protein
MGESAGHRGDDATGEVPVYHNERKDVSLPEVREAVFCDVVGEKGDCNDEAGAVVEGVGAMSSGQELPGKLVTTRDKGNTRAGEER